MRNHVFMAMAALSISAGSAVADVSCKLSCNDSTGSCKTSLGETVSTVEKSALLSNCQSSDRKALSDMMVWYPRKTLLTRKPVSKDSVIATLVADGDPDCRGLLCLFDVKKGRVGGMNPMGSEAPSEGSYSSGAAIGLPYGQVLVPDDGLALTAADQADGRLELSDGSTSSSFAMQRGVVKIPASALQPGKGYRYSLTTGAGATATGDFWVAPKDKARRVDEAVDNQLRSMSESAENKRLLRVSILTEANLRWDAKRLFQEP